MPRRPSPWLPLLLLALLPAAARAGVDASPELRARAARGPVPVLVGLAVGAAPEHRLAPGGRALQRARIAAAGDALQAALPTGDRRLRRRYDTLPFLALEVGGDALAALERSPDVVSIEPDRLMRAVLNDSVPLLQGDVAHAAGYDGTGQVVVVLDTGVDWAHPNFAGKLVAEACFAQGENGGAPGGDCPNGQETDFSAGAGSYCDYAAGCFHGTHVAGIAVGSGPNYSGVAIDAGLASIQIASRFDDVDTCDPEGGDPELAPCALSWESDQIAAFEYVYTTLRQSHAIASVNLSWGSDETYASQATCDAGNSAIKSVIDDLRAVDIASAIAAGNQGQDDALAAPACLSSAISVGAVNDAGAIPSFSNAASFLSLWAPGASIAAPRWQSTGYVFASGTSMAAPHVAGTWAILREAVPGVSVSGALAALKATGIAPITPTQAQTTYPQIADAIAALQPECSNGVDDDGDGLVDAGADPGCAGAFDLSETDPALVCDDGADNDGDGLVDAAADPGCRDPLYAFEDPDCDDGLDNDADGGIDWDGDPADPQCSVPYRNNERPSSCGLGFELALLAPLLAPLLARARRRR